MFKEILSPFFAGISSPILPRFFPGLNHGSFPGFLCGFLLRILQGFLRDSVKDSFGESFWNSVGNCFRNSFVDYSRDYFGDSPEIPPGISSVIQLELFPDISLDILRGLIPRLHKEFFQNSS